MVKQFSAYLKKDINLIIQNKFYLIMLGTLLLYSFYINFVYVKTDLLNYPVYIYNQTDKQILKNIDNFYYLESQQEIYENIKTDKEGVGIILEPGDLEFIISSSGSSRIDNLKYLYARYLLEGDKDNSFSVELIGSDTFEQTKRKEMSSEIVFFEISALSFLGIAALFFKEKGMGVLKVYGILPSSKILLLLSKLLVFFFMEVIFVTLLNIINLGIAYSLQIYRDVIIQVLILSPLMVLLGFLFSLVYKNFKQFVFAYTVIIIALTSPVFLFTNTALEWAGIKFFPTYYLYDNLNKAYFNIGDHSRIYYLICALTLFVLFLIDILLFKRELKRG